MAPRAFREFAVAVRVRGVVGERLANAQGRKHAPQIFLGVWLRHRPPVPGLGWNQPSAVVTAAVATRNSGTCVCALRVLGLHRRKRGKMGLRKATDYGPVAQGSGAFKRSPLIMVGSLQVKATRLGAVEQGSHCLG